MTASRIDAVRTGQRPSDLTLPAYYGDVSIILDRKDEAFTATTHLVKLWLQLPTQEQVEVLAAITWSADVTWLTAFLAEIAYYGIAVERDPAIAESIRSAVHATSFRIAPIALFLLDHIERVCPHDLVRQRAHEDAETIRLRLGALGH
ncbi:MAG: hypothetical protein H6834_11385 [Planctomycetes bacterium]|nr:hypothetical protein [Planctomycetota bacterium]